MNSDAQLEILRGLIRAVPDFPKPGILFRDITPALEDPKGLAAMIDIFTARYKDAGITRIVGIESRGFIIGAPLAKELGIGFTVLRKPGKLPRKTISRSYALEYGEDSLHIHADSLGSSDKVVIVDDLIATGGTARAACELVNSIGATVHELSALIELTGLPGRETIGEHPVHSFLQY